MHEWKELLPGRRLNRHGATRSAWEHGRPSPFFYPLPSLRHCLRFLENRPHLRNLPWLVRGPFSQDRACSYLVTSISSCAITFWVRLDVLARWPKLRDVFLP